MTPISPDSFRLLLEGSLSLARMEHNGIRVDTDYLEKSMVRIDRKVSRLQEEMREDEVYKVWKGRFREKTLLSSPQQLATILYEELNYPCKHRTKPSKSHPDGQPKVDADTLSEIDLPFLRLLSRVEKYKDAKGTFLKGIQRELVDGFIHPMFSLHLAKTFRSSSQLINFQNLPIRDPEIGKIIRQCFIPRKGRQLVEVDFGALEFRIAAAVWKDQKMMEYASNPKLDIHRDMAAKIFKCKKELVTKEMRYLGKNGFVFPRLYGSYYIQIARNIWEAMVKQDLKMTNGESVKSHLSDKGIVELGLLDSKISPREGTFEGHMKKVETRFDEDFPTLAKGKEDWIRQTKEEGGFTTVTGFQMKGIMSNNLILNGKIQGPAFHIALESCIRHQMVLDRLKMKSLQVAEIHDCILLDCPEREVSDVLSNLKEIMTIKIPKDWKWLIVPLIVESDVTSLEGTWHDKKPVVESNGIWKWKDESLGILGGSKT